MYRLVTANRNYSSWSLRPWVLMRTLGIPFEDQVVTFAGLDNYREFRSFSPNGMVPALIDGDRTVWDSLGIALYLADRHEGVWPADPGAKAWAQCVACEMHGGFSALRNDCTMNVGVRVRRKPDSDALQRDTARIAEIFEQGIERFGGPFLPRRPSPPRNLFFAPVVFRVPYLRPGAWRQRTGVGRTHAGAPRDARMGGAGTARALSRGGARGELAAAGLVTEDLRLTVDA